MIEEQRVVLQQEMRPFQMGHRMKGTTMREIDKRSIQADDGAINGARRGEEEKDDEKGGGLILQSK